MTPAVVQRPSRVAFVAFGEPKPKGSFRAYTYARSEAKGGGIGARATDDNPKTKPWQAVVATAAAFARRGAFFDAGEPVAIDATFYFVRPKSVSAAKRPHMTVKPDEDKLSRAVKDALKGVLYVDDGQVTRCVTEKRYAAPGEPARAEIAVWRREEAAV